MIERARAAWAFTAALWGAFTAPDKDCTCTPRGPMCDHCKLTIGF